MKRVFEISWFKMMIKTLFFFSYFHRICHSFNDSRRRYSFPLYGAFRMISWLVHVKPIRKFKYDEAWCLAKTCFLRVFIRDTIFLDI